MESASVVSRCCSSAFDSNNTPFGKTNPGFSRNLPVVFMWRRPSQRILLLCRRRSSLMTPVLEDEKEEEEAEGKSVEWVSRAKEGLPKVDRSGRFCSPRAGRELALSILYAACLEGSDPVRLLEKRMNTRREPGYEFDKASLLEYNHMSFGGLPVTAETAEEADELSQIDEKETAIEAEVLSAPPKLVYSKLILRFTRKLLLAVVDRWDNDVLVIEKVAPPNWKNAPAGKIIEFCILHLAMSEIAVLGTRHQIVMNEAVDLAKRFCDGAALRIINGCLRSFIKDFQAGHSAHTVESEKQVAHDCDKENLQFHGEWHGADRVAGPPLGLSMKSGQWKRGPTLLVKYGTSNPYVRVNVDVLCYPVI